MIMTRDKDESLAEGENGNRKVQDMKARVKRINDTKPDLAVSIHQNSYHEEVFTEHRFSITNIPKAGRRMPESCRRHCLRWTRIILDK